MTNTVGTLKENEYHPAADKALAPQNELGQLVKAFRGDKSQSEFGKMFGVSHAAVSDWERGISDVPGELTLALIAAQVTKTTDRSFDAGYVQALNDSPKARLEKLVDITQRIHY